MEGSDTSSDIRRRILSRLFFSAESVAKDQSYMNEELVLAIDELRLRPTDRAWFIPVRLNACSIPRRSIGGGETLTDIQWVDLSENWDVGVDKLVQTLNPAEAKYIEAYEGALQTLISTPRIQRIPKSGSFTVAVSGVTSAGKTSLVTALFGKTKLSPTFNPTYTERLATYEWPGIGRLIDLPSLNYLETAVEEEFSDVVRTQVDLLIYIINASSRIHRGDVDSLSKVNDTATPCLIVVNKLDQLWGEQEDVVVRYVHEKTGRPTVTVSALFQTNVALLHSLIERFAQTCAA